jgi:hypothetical protein
LLSFPSGSDDDDVVIAAFKSFDEGDGTIDTEKSVCPISYIDPLIKLIFTSSVSLHHNLFITYRLRHALMTWGDKFSGKEVDDCYEQFPIGESRILAGFFFFLSIYNVLQNVLE